MSVAIDEQYVRDHFGLFCRHDNPAFLQRVSPTVHTRLMGSMSISGDYHSLDEFASKALGRVASRLDGHMTLTLNSCIVGGRRAVVEMAVDVDSVKQKNGAPFPQQHCWVVHYDDSGVIDDMRIYLDGVMTEQFLASNPGS